MEEFWYRDEPGFLFIAWKRPDNELSEQTFRSKEIWLSAATKSLPLCLLSLTKLFMRIYSTPRTNS